MLEYQNMDLLLEGDVLVFNDTKVVKARLTGKKLTGGRAEIDVTVTPKVTSND